MKGILIFIQVLLLLSGYSIFLNQWITPSTFPYFNLLPLGFPIIFFANLFILIIWWLYRWKYALLFTLLSAPLLIIINKTYHVYGSSENNTSNLKVLTYNVRYFFDNQQGIINLLKEEEPDVIFFQEMGNTYKKVLEKINASRDVKYKVETYRSLGIISHYPVIESGFYKQDKNGKKSFSYADIKIKKDTIRFLNFHLESLHIDQGGVKKLKNSFEEIDKVGEGVIKRVINASKKHQNQLVVLREYIIDSPHPIILAGDMNAVPSTYEYFTISRSLKDAFIYGGKGLGSTFPGFKFPLRLDYIFVSPEIKVKSYQVKEINHSDHYPVISELEIP